MKTKSFRNVGTKLVPVSMGGAQILISPASIAAKERTTHHGTFEGVTVNSPQTRIVGDSVVLWPEAGKDVAITMDKAALGVLSTKFLESQGYTVTKTAASTGAS